MVKHHTYAYQNNILSIPARLLYEDWGVLSYENYLKQCGRGKLRRTKSGKGKGNEAWVSYYDLPDILKDICVRNLGKPQEVMVANILNQYMMPDPTASRFFEQHRTPKGLRISSKKQREKVHSCIVLNAIKYFLKEKNALDCKKVKVWQKISEAVNSLDTDRWHFNLPGHYRRLRQRYQEYIEQGYTLFIHKGEGNVNSAIIRGEIADFLLATYCLPTKPRVPEVWQQYESLRYKRGWDYLSEQAINNWLDHPERKRIWMLARHGKEEWAKHFKHTLTRDRSNWYPNAYWAIDGTKLDWIHTWESSSNKLGAQLKIDVLFDVFSERILGSSLSFTEKHFDHFKAIEQGVKMAKCRPMLITYDQQSAHRSSRMQELYSSIVADGGTHYCHRSREHNSPAEQIFKRFQQQVVNRFWFSDGQGVQVRTADNRFNESFINENKHLIKSVEDLEQAWKAAVYKWNTSKHPHFALSRDQVYAMAMPSRQELSLSDIMNKMWLKETKPITYRAHGLDLHLSGNKYQYEVYNSYGEIDLEFRRKHVGRKFIVRYNPSYMETYVQLMGKNDTGEWIEVALAEPKRKHEVVPGLITTEGKQQWKKDFLVRDLELERDLNDYKELVNRTGISASEVIEDQEYYIKTKKDRPKEVRSQIEATESALSRL